MSQGRFCVLTEFYDKIAYSKYGNGEKLLLILHGWGCNKELFSSVAEHLSSAYTVVVPDLPGFGESAEPSQPYSVEDCTRRIIDFIKYLGFKKVSLMGHSYGGRVIIKMFSIGVLPFEIERVCLVDAAGIKPKKSLGQHLSLLFYKAGRKVLSLPPFKKLFPDAIDNWRRKRGSADFNSASEVMKKTLVLAVNEDLTKCLKNITAPTLLFWGDKDDATPLSDAKIMEKHIPDAGLVVLEGGSHYSFLENTPFFLRVADSFFLTEN
ncbi:MAG: alpha/beta hydrolase [Ruminococcaceae bacterium]|nr:alpha/beta hydrolase [Oscillospiraceae bacterium]